MKVCGGVPEMGISQKANQSDLWGYQVQKQKNDYIGIK